MSEQDTAAPVETLEKLKSAILNIDWEISDENITSLNHELAELRSVWQGQRLHQIYLQILAALSQYIATNKQQANPGVFPMLRNTFASLEELVNNPGDEEELNKKVMEHVDAYNDLKKAIASGSPTPPAEPKAEAESEPVSEPAVEQEPAPETAANEEDEEAAGEKEQPSTINRLLDDKEDHTTDSIFDSMLDEMVQVEGPDEEEEKPSPPPPKPPAGRPPVQAAYNKADGTEIEADRNIDEEFAEADELLDNFFEDEVPHPSMAAKKGGDEFDLSDLDEQEGAGVLDLGDTTEVDSEAAGEEEALDFNLEEEEDAPATGETTGEAPAESLELVEDSELDIFKVDEQEEAAPTPESREDVPEMEAALDDFFEGEEEPVAAEQLTTETGGAPAAPDDDQGEVEAALEGFFAEEETTESEVVPAEVPRQPEEKEAVPPPVPSESVENLIALLQSVDWEVDDQLVERVEAELAALSAAMTGNAVALIHLNFLKTVIHYIGKEQSQVIDESMTCLKMISESLADCVKAASGDATRYAAQAVEAFTDWHELVVAEFDKRLAAAQKEAGPEVETTAPVENQRLKNEILAEVQTLVRQEIETLRQELSPKD